MPATSRAQQIAMAIAKTNPSKLYARNQGMLEMSQNQLHDYAATARKGLPEHVKQMAKVLAKNK